MILVAGGTGRLGIQIVRGLTANHVPVRILARHPEPAGSPQADGPERRIGNARDPGSLEGAFDGVTTVISAITGFPGFGGGSPKTVDWMGNRNLIHAARQAGVDHFVLISIAGAALDHPMELARMKYRAEEELKGSGLAWTILRPTAYMEAWMEVLGDPLLKRGKVTIFGRGENPINFVSTHQVAQFVDLAVHDPGMRGAVVEIGGPENLSTTQFVRTVEAATGRAGKEGHVPLPMMRLMSVLMRPLKPTLARLAETAIVMDRFDMTFDPTDMRTRYPTVSVVSLMDVLRRDYPEAARAAATTPRDA